MQYSLPLPQINNAPFCLQRKAVEKYISEMLFGLIEENKTYKKKGKIEEAITRSYV